MFKFKTQPKLLAASGYLYID